MSQPMLAGAELPESGLDVVLSPLQLAAILENDTIEETASLANRFWGLASVVGGAVELVGAAALLLTPEPTAVTKVAGAALGVHGVDTTHAGLVQIVSGRTRTTFTSQAAQAAAQALGADRETAGKVGMAVDIAVPLAAGIVGAARALAIRKGALRLMAEESAGGHTIARHIGKTEAELRARLVAQPKISAASTFRTLGEAEKVIAEGLRINKAAIKSWAKSAVPGQTKAFTHDAGRVVGFGVLRSTNQVTNMTKIVVVLRKVVAQNRVYFVLTAYPKPF